MLFRRAARALPWRRCFSSTSARREIRDITELPDRIHPNYNETRIHDLLSLQWPSPPRNVLITKKDCAPEITSSVIEYCQHIHDTYPNISLLFEPKHAAELHDSLPFPVYTTSHNRTPNARDPPPTFADKADFVCTLGGDGTILHASSLFATTQRVPPILSFGMGTLGFLGEWKFREYKKAFREVYMSGASDAYATVQGRGIAAAEAGEEEEGLVSGGWPHVPGKSMGSARNARVLLRNRLKVGLFNPSGNRIGGNPGDVYAMNEVIVHRGGDPHLAIVEVFVGGRFLTEAVADGMIISTPTGSTAYSLSAGGCIVHPLVSSLLLTPICPRSLSFRPLVLPANAPITLRLSEKNRGREVEVSIDGVMLSRGMGVGMEVRVLGEDIRDRQGNWAGGVPSIVRGVIGQEENGEDHWVGGLNGLLKFNYPFGEEI